MENDKTNPTQQTPQDTTDLLKVIEDMQKNMVSKEQYEALQADNRKLVQSIANGARVSSTVNNDTTVSAQELVKKMQSQGITTPELSNLEYVKTALQYRDAVLQEKGVDVFLPNGHTFVATEADIATAQHIADVLRECVELADGNNTIFTAQLQSRLVDVPINRKKL